MTDSFRTYGIELYPEGIRFIDDYQEEHRIKFEEINEICLEQAYAPKLNKLRFWLSKLFGGVNYFNIFTKKADLDDYRMNYIIEIELKTGLVISNTYEDAYFIALKDLVESIKENI